MGCFKKKKKKGLALYCFQTDLVCSLKFHIGKILHIDHQMGLFSCSQCCPMTSFLLHPMLSTKTWKIMFIKNHESLPHLCLLFQVNVEGDNCDRCKPGTLGLSVRNPLGCSKCYCYGLTQSCTEAQGLIRMWVSRHILIVFTSFLSRFNRNRFGWKGSSDPQQHRTVFFSFNVSQMWDTNGHIGFNENGSVKPFMIWNQFIHILNLISQLNFKLGHKLGILVTVLRLKKLRNYEWESAAKQLLGNLI